MTLDPRLHRIVAASRAVGIARHQQPRRPSGQSQRTFVPTRRNRCGRTPVCTARLLSGADRPTDAPPTALGFAIATDAASSEDSGHKFYVHTISFLEPT